MNNLDLQNQVVAQQTAELEAQVTENVLSAQINQYPEKSDTQNEAKEQSFTARIKELRSNSSLFDVFTMCVHRTLLNGQPAEPVSTRRILDSIPHLLGHTTVQNSIQSLVLHDLLIKVTTGGYQLTDAATELCKTEIAADLEQNFQRLTDIKENYANLTDLERAKLRLGRNKGLIKILELSMEVASEDPKGCVRANPIGVRLGKRPGVIRMQLKKLQEFGLLDQQLCLTPVAIAWAESKKAAPEPQKRRATTAGSNKKTQNTPVNKSSPPASKKTTKVTVNKEDPKKPAADHIKNDTRKKSEEQKPETPVLPPVPAAKNENNEAIQKALEVPGLLKELSTAISNPHLREKDKDIIVKAGLDNVRELLAPAKIVGEINHLLVSNTTTPVVTSPRFTIDRDNLVVQVDLPQLNMHEFLAYLNGMSESLSSSRTINFIPAPGITVSPAEKILSASGERLYNLLNEDALQLSRHNSRVRIALNHLRDSLEIAFSPQVMKKGDKQHKQLVENALDRFTKSSLEIFHIGSLTELENISSRDAVNPLTLGSRLVREVLLTDPQTILVSATAFLTFGRYINSDNVIDLTAKVCKISYLSGVPFCDIRDHRELNGRLRYTNLPSLPAEDTANKSFLYEQQEYPGVALEVGIQDSGNLYNIKSIYISPHGQADSLLDLLIAFEKAKALSAENSRFETITNHYSKIRIVGVVELVSVVRKPTTGSGEVWVTNGIPSGRNFIKEPSYNVKLRLKPNSGLIDVISAECINSRIARESVIYTLKSVAEHNISMISSELTKSGSYIMTVAQAEGEIKRELDFPLDMPVQDYERLGEWVGELSKALESGSLNVDYFYTLARHPMMGSARGLLDAAIYLTYLEQKLKQITAGSGLEFYSMSAANSTLSLNLKGAGSGYAKLLVDEPQAPAESKSVKLIPGSKKHFASNEFYKDQNVIISLKLVHRLLHEYSLLPEIPSSIIHYKYGIESIRYMSDMRRISEADAIRAIVHIRKKAEHSHDIPATIRHILPELTWSEIEVAFLTMKVFGVNADTYQISLVADVFKILCRQGFSDALINPLSSSLEGELRNKLKNPDKRIHITDSLPYPSTAYDRIIIADNLKQYISEVPAAEHLAKSSFAIEVKWKYPDNALLPHVKRIYINENVDLVSFEKALISVHQTLKNITDNPELDIISALADRRLPAAKATMFRSFYPGDTWLSNFDQSHVKTRPVWISDGVMSRLPNNGSQIKAWVFNDSYGLLTVPAHPSELLKISRFYHRADMHPHILANQRQLEHFREVVRKVFAYNLEIAKKYIQSKSK